MVTIKAWTNANREIQWNYDTPQQASPVWKKITETGRTPDTSEGLSRAYYWGPTRKRGEGPDKAWAA
jgi:hypothetical protein